jgi:hypothetical protein
MLVLIILTRQNISTKIVQFFHICGSVYHQSILLINQLDAALSSLIHSLLRVHSTCLGFFLHPSSGVQVNCKYSHRLKGVQGREYIAQCHGQVGHLSHTTQTHEMYLWVYPQFTCTPDDGCRKHPKHVEWTRSKEYLRLLKAAPSSFINKIKIVQFRPSSIAISINLHQH